MTLVVSCTHQPFMPNLCYKSNTVFVTDVSGSTEEKETKFDCTICLEELTADNKVNIYFPNTFEIINYAGNFPVA